MVADALAAPVCSEYATSIRPKAPGSSASRSLSPIAGIFSYGKPSAMGAMIAAVRIAMVDVLPTMTWREVPKSAYASSAMGAAARTICGGTQYASPSAASPCHPEPQRRVCLDGRRDASLRAAGPGSACSHLFWSSLPLLTPLTLIAFDELFLRLMRIEQPVEAPRRSGRRPLPPG